MRDPRAKLLRLQNSYQRTNNEIVAGQAQIAENMQTLARAEQYLMMNPHDRQAMGMYNKLKRNVSAHQKMLNLIQISLQQTAVQIQQEQVKLNAMQMSW